MFTGIVEELGVIKSVAIGAKSIQLTIEARKVLDDLHLGDSIAVNGTCLTVVQFDARRFTADVMPETMRLTVLQYLKPGDTVNLERALTLNSRLGGHVVSGHVDGIGTIMKVQRDDNAIIIKIKVDLSIAKYIVKKGSVTVDGVSLTVVDVGDNWFTISMIPHTAAVTILGSKNAGDFVNIENDIIGKYVERLLLCDNRQEKPDKKSRVTRQLLDQYGF